MAFYASVSCGLSIFCMTRYAKKIDNVGEYMALIVDIKVVPQSGKQLIKLDKNDRMVCYIKSPAERGLANRELLKYIAQLCKITQADVTIIGGSMSRTKRIKIDAALTYEQFLKVLGLTKQLTIFD